MSAAATEARKLQSAGRLPRFRLHVPLLIAFSLFYFADVSLRASEKFFWYDELFTVYFARLPNFHSLWNALNNGIDFNPPLFYLLTQWSNLLFGEGNVATRLPEILGFWIFCLCLFRFVSRRAGLLAGCSALLFPMLTGAYFYAYEARPHAIVLSGCGLALVCWQMAVETSQPRPAWLLAFGAALFCTFLLHCYAVTLLAPFILLELFRSIYFKRIQWGVWLAFAVPALLALPLYVPLLHSYRKLTASTNFSKVAVAGWTQVWHFYDFLFEPCILVVLAALMLFALDVFGNRRDPSPSNPRKLSFATVQDLLLAVAFTTLPACGVALGKLVQGPFFHRYFLGALAGVCILIGIGAGLRTGRLWIPAGLALLMIAGVTINFSRLLLERMHGRGEWLEEGSSHYALTTVPGQPLALNQLLVSDHTGLPVAVLSPLDFLYLVHYAPDLKPKLYFVASSQSDFTDAAFRRFLQCCPIVFNEPATYLQFARSHTDYLAYGSPGDFNQIALLGQLGGRLASLQVQQAHFLAHFTAEPAASGGPTR
ncbi:MAG: glycosyltransferase family 39 protein [Acidobacteriaceae bacterium]|nr:glycosyltransferase family 39 protein [Acidobacteriaceae bacterium]